jgi:hypothetical protein
MFWARRKDLWSDPNNVEAKDWDGTPNTGRSLNWQTGPGSKADAAPPQMCFNSKVIQREVQQRSTLLGKAIQAGVNRLQRLKRPELFAGVIVGSETQIGQDFKTGKYLGYRALLNRGFSRSTCHGTWTSSGKTSSRNSLNSGRKDSPRPAFLRKKSTLTSRPSRAALSSSAAIRDLLFTTQSLRDYVSGLREIPPARFLNLSGARPVRRHLRRAREAPAGRLGIERGNEFTARKRARTIGHDHGNLPGEDVQPR